MITLQENRVNPNYLDISLFFKKTDRNIGRHGCRPGPTS